MSGQAEGPESAWRRAARRKLPFGRGARLVVNGRTHIVGLGDVSASGAYLIARVAVRVGDEHLLKLLVVPALHELALRARVVRIVEEGAESAHHPRGIAVQFVDVDASTHARLETFVKAGNAPRA